jgi:hypothetical protein
MKNLRADSVSASEVAEQSAVSVMDNAEEEDAFANGSPRKRDSVFDPEAARNESSELNEEDIFRMKSLSLSRKAEQSLQAGQSAMSQVDSTSNFDEHMKNVNLKTALCNPSIYRQKMTMMSKRMGQMRQLKTISSFILNLI